MNKDDYATTVALGLVAVWLLVVGSIGYIALHFIIKYW